MFKGQCHTAHCLEDSRLINVKFVSYNDQASPPLMSTLCLAHVFPLPVFASTWEYFPQLRQGIGGLPSSTMVLQEQCTVKYT